MLIAHTRRGEGVDASEDGTGRGIPLVTAQFLHMNKGRPDGRQSDHEPMVSVKDHVPTLTTDGHAQSAVAYPIQECNVSRANLNGTGTGIGEEGDPMFTLQSAQPHGVCASLSLRTRDGVVSAELGVPGIANALRGSDGGRAGEGAGAVLNGMQVRRLTPVECERLQGFPDGYTNIPWRGKPESPDGPRYKALGNSWAVPCARWIGERIKAIRP